MGCVLLENFLNNELLEVTFSNWKEGLSRRVSLWMFETVLLFSHIAVVGIQENERQWENISKGIITCRKYAS